MGILSALFLIDSFIIIGRAVRKATLPAVRIILRVARRLLSTSLLSVFFLYLKIRRRIKKARSVGWYRILVKCNVYVYRVAIVVIASVTLVYNISVRTINAEKLHTEILLNAVVGTVDEVPIIIIEEGPLNPEQIEQGQRFSEQEGVITELSAAPPQDAPTVDQDLYATTGDESALIAPILTDIGNTGPTGRDRVIAYTVQSGDTISTIADSFNLSINTILWQNNLAWNSTIRPGQELSILPLDGISHEVKKGETVSQIAKKYQVDMEQIVEYNKLADAADISIGEKLLIPGGVKPAVVVVQRPVRRTLPEIIKDIVVPPAATFDADTKLLWPMDGKRITQNFTFRHSGLDIADKTGLPIFAAENGRVERAGWNRGYGYNVMINHGGGLQTLYAHASKLLVSEGDVVARGQTIALIGSTGWSSGPHLHFEVYVNGRRINPLNYIR